MEFRPGNRWLHSWAGVLLGGFLYVIFFTGTLSFYRQELNFWHWPALHQSQIEQQQLAPALDYLKRHAADAERWRIDLADVRRPVLQLSWRLPGQSRRTSSAVWFDSQTGQVVDASARGFSDFLYRLHFELYGIPRQWGRALVGVATWGMLLALLTGLVIHRRLLLDFFTFRPRHKLRTWLDLHNVSAVLALPFQLVITYSGLLLVMFSLMPWAVEALYEGDWQSYRKASGGKGGFPVELPIAKPQWQLSGEQVHLDDYVELLNQRWPEGVARLTLEPEQQQLELEQRGADSLLNRAARERWQFDLSSGQLLQAQTRELPSSSSQLIYNLTTALHLQRHADPLQRAIYFIAGVFGTVMTASGLLIWAYRRQRKRPAGIRLVEVSTLALVGGLPLAVVVALSLSRLSTLQSAPLVESQITLFFSVFCLVMIWSWMRDYYGAWRDLLVAIALAASALAIFDILFLYPGTAWFSSVNTVLAIDLSLLLLGAMAAVGAWQLHRRTEKG